MSCILLPTRPSGSSSLQVYSLTLSQGYGDLGVFSSPSWMDMRRPYQSSYFPYLPVKFQASLLVHCLPQPRATWTIGSLHLPPKPVLLLTTLLNVRFVSTLLLPSESPVATKLLAFLFCSALYISAQISMGVGVDGRSPRQKCQTPTVLICHSVFFS